MSSSSRIRGSGDADVPEQFLDEERVSVRVLGDVPREPGRRLLPGLDGDQGSDVRLAEPFEGLADAVRVRAATRRSPLRGPGAGQSGRSERTEQHQRRALGRPDDVAQQQEARVVGPVQIVEHQDRRPGERRRREQPRDRLEQADSLAFGLARRRPLDRLVAELGREQRQLLRRRGAS